MPDICMCTGNCPVKEMCYRYMAEPDRYWQTYSSLGDVCIPNGYSEFIPYDQTINKMNHDYGNYIDYNSRDFIIDNMIEKLIKNTGKG